MKVTRPGMIWVHRLLVVMALVWSTASAQDATTPSAEPSTSAIATSDVAARADADEQLADSVQRRVQGLASNESFAERLKALTASRDRLKAALRPVQLSVLPLRRLESLERHWQFLLREMERWRADIQRAIKPLSTEAEALAGKRAEWQATLTAADAAASPWSVRARQVLRRLDAAEATLTAPSAALLRLSHSAGALGNDIEGGLEGTRAQLRLKDRQLLRLDAPPIWQTQELAQQANRASVHREGLAIESAFAADYDSKYRRGIDTMTLSMLLLLPLLIWISRRTRARARREHVPEATLAVLSRPFAAWIVLYALTWMLFNWDGPVLRHEVTLLIAWLPVLRLLPAVLRQAMGPWAWISAVFYALNFGVSLLAADALIYRYALLALSVALIATLLLLAQRRRRAMEPSRARTRSGTWSGQTWTASWRRSWRPRSAVSPGRCSKASSRSCRVTACSSTVARFAPSPTGTGHVVPMRHATTTPYEPWRRSVTWSLPPRGVRSSATCRSACSRAAGSTRRSSPP